MRWKLGFRVTLNIGFLIQSHCHEPPTLAPTLDGARAERTFWTVLTVQHGVTVSHDIYVQCYVITEGPGCNGMPLGKAWNAQTRKSGHLDKGSIPAPYGCGWDLHPLKLRARTTQHSSLGHTRSPARLPLHWLPAAAWLETEAGFCTCYAASDRD